jgi:hypothetical protein
MIEAEQRKMYRWNYSNYWTALNLGYLRDENMSLKIKLYCQEKTATII